MRYLLLAAACMLAALYTYAQCPASGTDIEWAWVNPAGTYLDLGSKRPLNETHHKIFDLRTGKFVATGTNKYEFPLRGYGFVYETETRFRISDFTNWTDYTTKIWVSKDGKDVINRAFTKYTKIFYDTMRGRGVIVEPTEGSSYKLYYLTEGSEPELIDKRFRGSTGPFAFSPNGQYLVIGGNTIIDMDKRKVLTTKLTKKWINFGTPVISPDGRYVAYHGKQYNSTKDKYLLVYDIASEELVRQVPLPDSLNGLYKVDILPLPDMKRAAVVIQRTHMHYYETGTAYILSEAGLEPLCYPGWRRERDEFNGKTSIVYNDEAAEKGACPMDLAAMEADGKWDFTADGSSGVLYLSARPSGEVSGTYTYTKGTTKMKGKLSGKLSAGKEGDACVHQISGSYDESLFGGGKGTLTLKLGTDGKTISGKAGVRAWSGKKS